MRHVCRSGANAVVSAAVGLVTTWGVSELRLAHPIILLKRPLA
jgi:hypothetical protein